MPLYRFFNAAIRELFEEVDISLTAPRLWTALTQADRRQWRHRIVDDKDDFGSLLRRAKCAAQVDELLPFSHVITPEGSPHRFDTWFFLARITGADVPHTHNSELDGECLWLTAHDALAGYSKGLFAFATPQLYLLHQFRQFESTNKLWATAKADAAIGNIPTVLPQRLPPSVTAGGFETLKFVSVTLPERTKSTMADVPTDVVSKDDEVQPPCGIITEHRAEASRPRRVHFSATSVAVTCVFVVNLVAMPLKPYLTEPLPISDTAMYRAPVVFPSVSPSLLPEPAVATIHPFKQLYNNTTLPHGAAYYHDPVHVVEVMRTSVSSSACADPVQLITSILGVPYFPPDVKRAIVDSVCGRRDASIDVGRVWRIYFGSKQDSLSAAWVVADTTSATNDKFATVYFTFTPYIWSPTWIVAKFVYRFVMSMAILAFIVYKYYVPLRHLRRNLEALPLHVSSTAVRYEIVVGEPTCLVLSNVWVCLAFVVDFFASTEFFGAACLRMGQTADMALFFLGVLYLGRTVWCAYMSLVLLNIVLKRVRRAAWAVPANSTTLAIAVTVGGGLLTTIQVKLPPLMAFYTWLLTFVTTTDARGNVSTLDDTAAMMVYVFGMIGTCFGIVLGKKYAGLWLTKRRKQLRNRIRSIQVGATYTLNENMPRAGDILQVQPSHASIDVPN
ncbi:hypothetical protein DYB32_004586 [Aphanomyces invadans]|uniref:Nudix hydrolase domain-containing protein n=1 Tax=Aphanomyces invadans TaxID=157072 RepID=A0A418AX26_9STRA|nr:hypothetical protein DYB32_004586 [Aphanomyces invadans]